ncbi:C69 family dipeptidase [Streptococcus panodentis]|uniref:Dipeptidase n=1 Tax=Streptococcus panodentis TaxID=1581472 RepID=A0ABS5AXE8_9STRE|nr:MULTISPECIES: C69 family dipeptidase [Streptococcus]KXT82229.1 putative dipeptidase B [Streptococcus sp. DD11]MBP2621249.1 peptidase C69 [Streptococcus panodentis]
MKKVLFKMMFLVMLLSMLPVQVAQACSAFIVGKGLTADGSTLYGRTEDYPYAPDGGRHNQNYVVVPAKTYKEGDQIEDESNGFTYPHLANEMKYTATYDSARGDGSNGNFGAHGFNEAGVSMTATVSAAPNDKILTADPLVKDGLPEASMIDLVLPRAKSAREAIEIVAKTLDEKGSAEGNIIVTADQNELWYMEILSGHQYVAIKFPEDKYAVFANTYYLGHVDLSDTDNVIASKGVEDIAKKADSYKTDSDGNFMIAQSYGPEDYIERNRSRTYAGIKWMDPQSEVTYEDKYFDLLRTPTDPNKRYTVQDVIGEQRNRFENLPEFLPDDTVEVGKDYDKNVYKYALGNENVIDAHVYQIKSDLPSEFGGVVWLGLAQSRNTPYVPFYGNVEDTYEAFKNRSEKYDGKSWYWSVWHIDQMVMKYPEIFGSSIQDKWKALEDEWVKEQAASDAKYAAYTDEQAQAAGPEVTKEALARSEKIFKEIKAVEAEMEAKIKKEKGDDADLVYTGYNKANLLADYEKSHKKDSKTKTQKSEAKKTDSSQLALLLILALIVIIPGIIALQRSRKKKGS